VTNLMLVKTGSPASRSGERKTSICEANDLEIAVGIKINPIIQQDKTTLLFTIDLSFCRI
jgi:hypothetical protein